MKLDGWNVCLFVENIKKISFYVMSVMFDVLLGNCIEWLLRKIYFYI